MPHIIIAVKEKAQYHPLAYSLVQEGYQVTFLEQGDPLPDAMLFRGCDVAVAEVPDPLLLCKFVRRKTDRPLIVIAKAGEEGEELTRTAVLEAGADDCLIAPCNMLECKSRIKALLRRAERQTRTVVSPEDVLSLDFSEKRLTIGSREVRLTETEAILLSELLKEEGRALTREEIAQRLWGREDENDLRSIDVHIKRLREKMETDRKRPRHIQSKWGYGYGLHIRKRPE